MSRIEQYIHNMITKTVWLLLTVINKDEGGLKGYLLIRYLCMMGINSIHDMNVVNTYITSYQDKTLRSSQKQLISRIRRSTSTTDLNIVITSFPFSSQWPAFSRSRWGQHLSVLIQSSWRNGRSPTHIPAVTWRIGLWSLLSGKHTAASGGKGFWPPK